MKEKKKYGAEDVLKLYTEGHFSVSLLHIAAQILDFKLFKEYLLKYICLCNIADKFGLKEIALSQFLLTRLEK